MAEQQHRCLSFRHCLARFCLRIGCGLIVAIGLAALTQRAMGAVRPMAAADCRTQVHNGLGVASDMRLRRVGFGQSPEGLADRAGAGPASDGMEAAEDTLDVAIKNCLSLPGAKGKDGGGG